MRSYLSQDPGNLLFEACQESGRGNRVVSLVLSSILHVLVLAGLCWQPAPIFVKPTFLVRGEGGASSPVTLILYLPRDLQVEPKPQAALLNLPAVRNRKETKRKIRKRHNLLEEEKTANSAEAGSTLGSSADGAAYGDEIKPALPVSFADPAISRSELPTGLKGDVIVEVTIDAQGNVVKEKLLQGLARDIDEKVLAAVHEWHYRPATRNGVPIPSKHDVHYHFPT